jgi:hypothetical protein
MQWQLRSMHRSGSLCNGWGGVHAAPVVEVPDAALLALADLKGGWLRAQMIVMHGRCQPSACLFCLQLFVAGKLPKNKWMKPSLE